MFQEVFVAHLSLESPSNTFEMQAQINKYVHQFAGSDLNYGIFQKPQYFSLVRAQSSLKNRKRERK